MGAFAQDCLKGGTCVVQHIAVLLRSLRVSGSGRVLEPVYCLHAAPVDREANALSHP